MKTLTATAERLASRAMPPHLRLQHGRGRGQVERAAAPGAPPPPPPPAPCPLAPATLQLQPSSSPAPARAPTQRLPLTAHPSPLAPIPCPGASDIEQLVESASNPRHAFLMTRGTWGDVQPFVALARGLCSERGCGDHMHRGALEGVGGAVCRHHGWRGALPLLGRTNPTLTLTLTLILLTRCASSARAATRSARRRLGLGRRT